MDKCGAPFIIPVFIPHQGCPHQCIFCDQRTITGHKNSDRLLLKNFKAHVERFLDYKTRKRGTVEIAFFGGNFMGLKNERLVSLLKKAAAFVTAGQVDGIRFSTRPDTINETTLSAINPFPVSTVELGVQSMDDGVLAKSKRGHSSRDTLKAISLLKKSHLKTGLQMMVGLPGDDGSSSIYTAKEIAGLHPDFVRIYPTIVLKGSPLAALYEEGGYDPMPLDKSVNIVKKIYRILNEKNIRVIRMGLQASKDLDQGSKILAGPYHPAFGHLVHSSLFLDAAIAELKKNQRPSKNVVIRVHPRNISRMQGLNKNNMLIMKNVFHLNTLDIIGDSSLCEETVSIHSKS